MGRTPRKKIQYQLASCICSFHTSTFRAVKKIDKDDIFYGVLAAMCMWEQNSNIRFKRTAENEPYADIKIAFGSGSCVQFIMFDFFLFVLLPLVV